MRTLNSAAGSLSSIVALGLAAGLALSLSIWSRPVDADAVPPEPERCPTGYIPVTSHAGPQCVLKPPTNCPPGWKGINGGTCVVHVCQTDAHCTWDGRRDLRCKPAKVCVHESLQEWGSAAEPPSTRQERSLFAAPPRRFDPPRKVQTPVNVCQDGRACPKDATCSPMRLCLPVDVDQPGTYREPKLPPSPLYMPPTVRRPVPLPPT